jgi:hypothetical protein
MKYKSEMKQGDLFQFCTRAMVTDTEEELIPCVNYGLNSPYLIYRHKMGVVPLTGSVLRFEQERTRMSNTI